VLADFYLKGGRWVEALAAMDAAPPLQGPFSFPASTDRALRHYAEAVLLEPTNPDYHVSLGRLYRERQGNYDRADREFRLAVALHPVNAGVRYAVAVQYLLGARPEQSFEQAAVLASIDESYRIEDGSAVDVQAREKRTPWYLSRLERSYLSKALEIAWRSSGKNAARVAGIVPSNPDAREAARLFFEHKGIDYDGLAEKNNEGKGEQS
jgi:tetratricopeptide (TPR) repeat protein